MTVVPPFPCAVLADREANGSARSTTRQRPVKGLDEVVCVTFDGENGRAAVVDGRVQRGADGFADEIVTCRWRIPASSAGRAGMDASRPWRVDVMF